ARPVGAVGPLYRPARGPDGAQGESWHDCPAGVRAFSGDPLNWQTQAIAVKDETSGTRHRPVFILYSSLSFVGNNPPSRDRKTGYWYALSDRGPGGGLLEYATRVQRMRIPVNRHTGVVGT